MSHLGSLLVVYENPIYNINRFVLQECVDFTWRVFEWEENVGKLPSLSLIPQFSTTISEAKLAKSSFSTFSCIDSLILKPQILFRIKANQPE